MSSTLHSKENLEFITVAAEFCLFLEQIPELNKQQFISRAVKYMPLLYLKTSLLSYDSEDYEPEPERIVTETDYELMRSNVASLLGIDDNYLEVFHPDMQYSDTPIAAAVSENIADIYQELKDYLYNCQLGNDEAMHDSLIYCLAAFRNHWGQKLLNALRALHQVFYNENNENEDNTEIHPTQPDDSRDISFFNYQRNK
ncbi:MAG: hypothetical protein H6Q17_2380 [Bacteroidetes bacterium]|nr:hypothetical protein [Bacteroidota bacterium]